MKKLALSLLLVSSIAVADETYYGVKELYMPNDAGDYTVLTLEPCEIESLKSKYELKAFSNDDSNTSHPGCWSLSDTPKPGLTPIVLLEYAEIPGATFSFKQHLFSKEKKRWTDTENPMKVQAEL